MLKKLTLAALTATFIAAGAAAANAEISGGGAPPGPTSERGLQMDYAAHHASRTYAYAPQWHRHTVHAKRN
jgi:hypothetical protein